MFTTDDDHAVLVEQIRSLRDYNRAKSAEIAELKNAEVHLRAELERRRKEIEKIYRSPTWRIGRLILSPALVMRVIFRKLRK
jgi:anti-sigma factor RsiW